MKCNLCHRRMVSLYITPPNKKTKVSIGKICIKCGIVESPTLEFQKLKRQIIKDEESEKNKKGYHGKPLHNREHPFYCWKCKSKRYKTKEKVGITWGKYENQDGSINYQRQNPALLYTCKKCNAQNRVSLPMPYPIPKKYLTPPEN